MSTCLTEFNEEAYKKGLLEEGRELGLEEGLRTACIENAKNLFKNGVSYELVRASIKPLSDEEMQRIYEEVMANKNV